VTWPRRLIPLQIFAGDMHGLNTLEHQPQKVAAMEGNWETRGNVPLVLFALPDEARANRFEIAIPYVGELILTHHLDGEVPGLNDFVAEAGPRCIRPWRRSSRLPGDGRHGHPDARGVLDGDGLAAVADRGRGCRARVLASPPWPSRAGSPRSPAGTSPRSAASPGW
jgi:cytochrome bd-type quinol oxidase subunit 1